MTQSAWYREFNTLKQIVENAGHSVRNDVFYTNGYDRPTKLFNRRNEVWLIKE